MNDDAPPRSDPRPQPNPGRALVTPEGPAFGGGAAEPPGRRAQDPPTDVLQRLALLYDAAPMVYFLSTLVAGATAMVLRPYQPPRLLFGWLSVVLAVQLGRSAAVAFFYRARRRGDLHEGWLRLHRWGSLASALVWGSSGLLLYPEGEPVVQLFLAFVLTGVAAGATTTQTATPLHYVAFVTPLLGPITVRLLASGSPLRIAAGALLIFYALSFSLGAWQLRRIVAGRVSARRQRDELAERLSASQQVLRAEVERRREVDQQVQQRDAILRAVAYAASRLLPSRSWMVAGPEIFRRLGEATQVSRVYLFTRREDEEGAYLAQLLEWTARGIEPQINNPELQRLPVDFLGFSDWIHQMETGQIIYGPPRSFPEDERMLLESQGILTIVMVPIFVRGQWWGFIGFDDCVTERTWSPVETEALRVAADTLGAAIQGDQAEDQLRESEERYRLLAEKTHDLVGLHEPDGTVLYFTPSCKALLGYEPEELIGTDAYANIHPEDRERVRMGSHHPILSGAENALIAYRLRTKSGDYRWFETASQGIRDGEGRVVQLVTSSRDITQRKEAEDQLFHEKELAQVTLQSIGDAVITTDADGWIQYINPVAEELTGWANPDARGRALGEVFHLYREETEEPVGDLAAIILESGLSSELPDQVFMVARDGERFSVQVTATPIRDRKGRTVGCVTVFRDVSRTRELAQQLIYQATHDPLTGLINRRELESRLARSLDDRNSRECPDVLCYIDLDQFKVVNDTCGHVAGDELLRQLTRLLQSRAREGDSVARLGGDEFGLLLQACPLDEAEALANRVCREIREVRFTWKEKVFAVGASIGVVEVGAYMEDVASVLKAADTACYAAKDRGRNRVHLYHPEDTELARRHGEMEWISRLHRALADDRLSLLYQPIVSTRDPSRTVERVEILLTMHDRLGNRIPPGSFIPAAEHYNLMPTLDRWVVRTTLESLAPHWREYPNCSLKTCFINLSSTSLTDPGFLAFLKGQLAEHRVPPGAVCFEITETAAITNLTDSLLFIEEVQRLGCAFALDDFGSGLSSFAHLKAMPVNFLKIDGAFVRDLLTDETDRALVESIHKIGHLLGLETIAEFVENDEILNRVAELNIDFAQGFGIARPAPLAELLVLLGGEDAGGSSGGDSGAKSGNGSRPAPSEASERSSKGTKRGDGKVASVLSYPGVDPRRPS